MLTTNARQAAPAAVTAHDVAPPEIVIAHLRPWCRVTTVDATGNKRVGTVTFTGDKCAFIVLDGEAHERVFHADAVAGKTDFVRLLELAGVGYLPSEFFTLNSQKRCTLTSQNYDLILRTGEEVPTCFHKGGLLLEVGHPYRRYRLADVAQLRPAS